MERLHYIFSTIHDWGWFWFLKIYKILFVNICEYYAKSNARFTHVGIFKSKRFIFCDTAKQVVQRNNNSKKIDEQ